MPNDGGQRLDRRAVCCALIAAVLTVPCTVPRLAHAQDPAGALHELSASTDFRVRVSAAVYLGRTRPAGAREALERALSDGHSAVRMAAATALSALGDPEAVGPLTRRLSSETSASVKMQIEASVERLRRPGAVGGVPGDGTRTVGSNVWYLVRLGSMHNPSGVRGEELRRILHDAAASRASGFKGGALIDEAQATPPADRRPLPIITLDGSLMQLTESRASDAFQVHARVEFTVRREQTLKGTLSGTATTFDSSATLSEPSRYRLQKEAVEAAVQSALRGADQGLIVAAR